MDIDYITVDVFTDERFGGNQLAVIPDARGIDPETMQLIAMEFNYSEITFVFPPIDPVHTAHVRIFTPTEELPFAGHPNVGTAYVLGRQGEVFGKPVSDKMIFEEASGLIEISLIRKQDDVVGAAIIAPKPLEIGPQVGIDRLAQCLSLEVKNFKRTHEPCFASVGLRFVIAELEDLRALADARPNTTAFREAADYYGQSDDRFSLFLYVRQGPQHLRARMFSTDTHEDPATGSASAALVAYLTQINPAPDLTDTLLIEQGVEMGRRSLINLRATKSNNLVTSVEVSGQCVPVMTGKIFGAGRDILAAAD